MQHDVQEFNRLLQDNIEKKMRGTPANDSIKQLFVGRMKSYIKCLDVDYESSRSEDYYGEICKKKKKRRFHLTANISELRYSIKC